MNGDNEWYTGCLTKEDIETIRIHMNAFKEELCNQRRWKEAEEYQQIVDKLVEFAKVSKERPKGKWLEREVHEAKKFYDIKEWQSAKCSVCGRYHTTPYLYYFQHYNYCPGCGAEMEGT